MQCRPDGSGPGGFARAALVIAALAWGQVAAAQDALSGYWLTDARDGVVGLVEVTPCGNGYCGRIIKGIDAAGQDRMEMAGQAVMRGMVPIGPQRYEGEVIDPRNGRVYAGGAEVSGNRLALKGCVLGGLICGTSNWVRPN